MSDLKQTRTTATRLLVDFLDYAAFEGDPASTHHVAQQVLDAIAEYTIQLAKQRKLAQLKENNLDRP